jgi:hypothetical protein
MDTEKSNNLSYLWDRLLSRKGELIQEAYNELDIKEKEAVLAHLKRMANEESWHPEQQKSAQEAIKALLID